MAGSLNHARTFPLLEKAQGLAENEADYGPSLHESLAKYDPDTHSLRTPQGSLFGDSMLFSVTLPKWGTMRNGVLWERTTLGLGICASDSGDWQGDEMWATPSVCGNYNRKGASATSGDGLATQVKKKMYPTPCASDHKGGGKTGQLRDRLDYACERGATKSKTYDTPQEGNLNPDWVETLMLWPIGWTRKKPISLDWRDGSEDPADTGEIPRNATGIKHRTPRLKAIGNGQVPLCAAVASALLQARLDRAK